MNYLRRVFSSSTQRQKIEKLLQQSSSPSLAENHLLRLIESGGAASINRIPAPDLPALLRLLGSSAYLSDILIRQRKDWPALFVRQIKINQKSTADHLKELAAAIKESKSFDLFCAALPRHKQRE